MMGMVKGEEWFGITYCWWEGDEDGWSRWEVWDRGKLKCSSHHSVAQTWMETWRKRWQRLNKKEEGAASVNRLAYEQHQRTGSLGGGCKSQAWISRWVDKGLKKTKRPVHHQLTFLCMEPGAFVVLNSRWTIFFFRWTIFARGEERPLNTGRLKTCLQVLGLGLIVSPLQMGT